MQWPDSYKEAFAAYRRGFAAGIFTGLSAWLFIGKPIYSLPLILGMLFGSIAFQLRIKKDNQKF